MSLSVKKSWTELLSPDVELTVSLTSSEVKKSGGDDNPAAMNLDEWPVLLFLKGVGFDSIIFRTSTNEVLETWTARLTKYQQQFISDPEHFTIDDFQWNELGSDGSLLIECILPKKSLINSQTKSAFVVPPLEAPLGIDPQSAAQFVEEVERQSSQETLLRIQSILREFQSDAKHKDPLAWAALIADIIAIALEARLLDKALQIASDFSDSLKLIWKKSDRALQLFSSYDPKPAELHLWAQIFSSCSTADLVWYLESQLSTPAGPQILKLMNLRAHSHPDVLMEIAFEEKPQIQKLLLPWLLPHWRLKHFPKILEYIRRVQKSSVQIDILKLWLNALLISSQTEALKEFETDLLPKKSWLRRTKGDHQHFAKLILEVLDEHSTPEVIHFFRNIKPQLSGEIADRVEKFLNAHRGVS